MVLNLSAINILNSAVSLKLVTVNVEAASTSLSRVEDSAMAITLKKSIADSLKTLAEKSPEKLVQDRQKKLLEIGKFKELSA